MPLMKEEGLRQSSRSMGVEKLKMLQWVLGKGWKLSPVTKGVLENFSVVEKW